jgi:flavin reductase (DIM6/NTAB) family NADH-FMN oxidoreductase RutF
MDKHNITFQWLPCPVVFICTAHGDQRDIMTANAMFVSEMEPLITISIATKHLTDQLITASGYFIVAIAATGQNKLAIQLGSAKGEKTDKYTRFSIKTLPQEAGDSLVPEGVSAWMKCKVESSYPIKGYRVVTGRVVKSGDLSKPPLIWYRDTFSRLIKE